jgi:hypothetical protein
VQHIDQTDAAPARNRICLLISHAPTPTGAPLHPSHGSAEIVDHVTGRAGADEGLDRGNRSLDVSLKRPSWATRPRSRKV